MPANATPGVSSSKSAVVLSTVPPICRSLQLVPYDSPTSPPRASCLRRSIPPQQDGDCRRSIMDGQSLLDVSTGFEDEGYLIPMLILSCADDIDSKILIDPQRDFLPFNFPHVCQCRTL